MKSVDTMFTIYFVHSCSNTLKVAFLGEVRDLLV